MCSFYGNIREFSLDGRIAVFSFSSSRWGVVLHFEARPPSTRNCLVVQGARSWSKRIENNSHNRISLVENTEWVKTMENYRIALFSWQIPTILTLKQQNVVKNRIWLQIKIKTIKIQYFHIYSSSWQFMNCICMTFIYIIYYLFKLITKLSNPTHGRNNSECKAFPQLHQSERYSALVSVWSTFLDFRFEWCMCVVSCPTLVKCVRSAKIHFFPTDSRSLNK